MKFWKDMPYWLRGGVIGGGITLVSIIFFYSCVLLDNSSGSFLCLPFLFFSPMLPFINLFDTSPYLRTLPFFSMEITSMVVWFIVGALIGTFIGYKKRARRSELS